MYIWLKEAEQPADVQEVIRLIRQTYPNLNWTRLWVSHPGADDDGIWFFWLPNEAGDVQIESSFGICPFDVATDKYNEIFIGNSVPEVTAKIIEWLALPGGSFESFWHPR